MTDEKKKDRRIDWKSIGQKVADASPIIGGLLGGPAGAAVGGLLANKFGTAADPEAVLNSLTADKEWAVKIREIEVEHEKYLAKLEHDLAVARLNAATADMTAAKETILAVNQTMQAESDSEHWLQYSWRPIWGLVSAAAFFVVCVLFCYLAYLAIIEGDQEALRMVPDLVSSFTMLFAIPGGILGVASFWRGKEKIEWERGNTEVKKLVAGKKGEQ